ncbi:anhydro-N-acetylmuramic acid kinase [Fulvivirga sp. M361]|uniref:anhydro-N-acetylmuramic acid kinase n=1 Tax=Fulvivirga sp. M361 TaxID=2594266 RepID=UPI00117B5C10|nr:anhydro-N-acetylmuramic acid kinase [Fulvivirga sp. M361]TRX50926.1 anhydro-N-acetylmuramic acid kinase [Fulvivirga sp. M361]
MTIKSTYHVIGLMSGTSLDGLDLAFCTFEKKEEKWSFQLRASKSIDYTADLRARLKESVLLSAVELLQLNNEYGQWLGEQVVQFVKEYDIKADFVASHGHTVFHQPEKGITYQIGSGQKIANACSLKVICDFRTLDVTLGGQGAPLVPIGDQLLFSAYDFCLNLGGISNVSFHHQDKRMAFDIGLANMPLNYLVQSIGKTYDANGAMARSGRLDKALFDQLNQLPYFKAPFPKSTGYEWFHDEVMPLLDQSTISVEDKLHTMVHHLTYQAAEAIKPFSNAQARLLVTGGGARNAFLIETLQQYLADKVSVCIPDPSIIDFKEAIVFALMGVLYERGEVNCLSSVTGAERDCCGGVGYWPL